MIATHLVVVKVDHKYTARTPGEDEPLKRVVEARRRLRRWVLNEDTTQFLTILANVLGPENEVKELTVSGSNVDILERDLLERVGTVLKRLARGSEISANIDGVCQSVSDIESHLGKEITI